ncbi:unnamed protein product [Urochloa humidicola]
MSALVSLSFPLGFDGRSHAEVQRGGRRCRVIRRRPDPARSGGRICTRGVVRVRARPWDAARTSWPGCRLLCAESARRSRVAAAEAGQAEFGGARGQGATCRDVLPSGARVRHLRGVSALSCTAGGFAPCTVAEPLVWQATWRLPYLPAKGNTLPPTAVSCTHI